jgi:hypothetical protein
MGQLEVITKYCYYCKQDKPVDEFYKATSKYKQKKDICKFCQSIKGKNYYVKNKDSILARSAKINQRNRELYLNYLLIHPCVDCGESDPVVLEADHVRDKSYDVSRMIQGWSWNRILQELEKCEIVCANCHRRRTAKSQGWFKNG